MSVFAGAHSTSVNQSQLYSIAGDSTTNYFFDLSRHGAVPTESSLDRLRQTIADWLSPLDFSVSQNEIFQRAAKGTGQWLLESKEFEAWRDGSSETLFCPGMPGAGKTALSSIVVEYLQTRFANDSKVAIAYIYLDYKKQNQQTPCDLISCLLKQLVQTCATSLDDLKSLYDRHRVRKTRPTLDDFTKALNIEISKFSKVFVVVDALDELPEENEARAQMLQALQSLVEPANLVVTSRFLPSIALHFQDTRRLEIRAHDEDVRKYIQSRIPRWYSKQLGVTVANELVKKADGMFLLARLHMDSLMVKHSAAQVTRALKNLPRGMEHAYDEAMKRIKHQDEFDRALAYRVLSWITFACRPLSVKELQYALAVSPGMTQLDQDEMIFEECLTSYCVGLVVIDEDSRIMRLVHHTTQEYFESRREVLFPEAQANITRTCITYLSFDDLGHNQIDDHEDVLLLLNEHPLLSYAARYWGCHARGKAEETEKVLLQAFLRHRLCVARASRILLVNLYGPHPPTDFSVLHLCAFFGLCETMRHHLENGEKPDSKDSWGGTPLSWAAEAGHTAVLNLLLSYGVVDVDSEDTLGWRPLSYAATHGHVGAVSLLLTRCTVDVNSLGPDGWTPLLLAASNGHNAVVDLLLANDAIDVNARDEYGRTPILMAGWNGHSEVVSLLLAREDIDINPKDDEGWTPLSVAALNGHSAVLNLLLARNVDVNSKDPHGRTPLSMAAEQGHETVVSLLLAHEVVDVNAKDSEGRSPLSWAAEGGHEAVISLLLAHENVDINAKDNKGRTPLSWAAEEGHDTVVKQLLSHQGITCDLKDSSSQKPLSRATEKWHDGVTKLLLNGAITTV